MNKWEQVREFFSQIETGSFVTRKMYMDYMEGSVYYTLSDLYRCYLQRAGYIYDGPEYRNRGIYFMAKPIPKDLTLTRVMREAYPYSVDLNGKRMTRREANKLIEAIKLNQAAFQ